MTTQLLEERKNTYGDFHTLANLSQTLYSVILQHYYEVHGNQKHLPNFMKESLHMICQKIARVVNGDPMYDDSWQDIAGYAQLVVDILNKATPPQTESKE